MCVFRKITYLYIYFKKIKFRLYCDTLTILFFIYKVHTFLTITLELHRTNVRCYASMWYEERSQKATKTKNPTFSLCCQDGKVLLPKLKEAPAPLKSLLDYNNSVTSKFREQIRIYNGMFCFTSFGAKIDPTVNQGRAHIHLE